MGEKAGELLLKKINNEKVPDEAKEKAELVIRESCGCLSFSSRVSIRKNIKAGKDREVMNIFLKEKRDIVHFMKKVLVSDSSFNFNYDELLNGFFDLLINDISSTINSDLFVKYPAQPKGRNQML